MNFNVGDETRKSKCHKMHVGKKHDNCPILTANDKITGSVEEICYLGDVVSNNLSNANNIKARIARGVGL